MVPKRKKPRNLQSDDAENPSVMISCNSKLNEDSIKENATNSLHTLSTVEGPEYKNLHIIKARNSLPKLDKEVLPNGNVYSRTAVAQLPQNPILLTCQVDDKPSSADPVCSKLLMSPELKQKPGSNFSNKHDGSSSSNFQAAMEQTNQMIKKEANPSKQNLSSLPSLDDKLDIPRSISPVAASVESVNGVKFEIDHMAPPVNSSPNSNDYDVSVDGNPQVSQNNHGHVSCESHNKRKAIIDLADKMAVQGPKAKKDSDIIELDKKSQMKMEAAEVATLEKQPLVNGKFGSCHVEHNQNKVNMMQNPQKTPEGTTGLADRMGQSTVIRTSTSTPIPITIPMWPSGLPPFEFLGCCLPIPRAHPHEPEEGKSAIPYVKMPFVVTPPRRPGHCATHCFIAQFIHFQQQLAKINPLWHATDSSLCSARPFSLNTGTLLFGGPVVKNPNFLSINNFGPTFGGPVVMNPEAIGDPKICQPSLTHLAHQGAAFMSPISCSRGAGPKAIDSEDFGSLSKSRASSAASASNNFSNFAGMQDPPYFTMFQSCLFPVLPGYQAPLSQQQQLPPPPLPSNSSQSFQTQSQCFQQSSNSTSSIGSSSPQNQLQLPPCFPSSKPPPGTCHNETEDRADSKVSLSQKKLQFVTPIAKIVGKHHDPADPSPQMSLKTIKVDIPRQPRQEIGSHHHYLLSDLQKQQKAPLKVHNTNNKSSVSNKVLKQSVPSLRYPWSTLSMFVSTESSMVYTDCNALIYCKCSGCVALHDTKNAQCNMPLSQKMPNHETSSVNSSSRKIRTMPTVSTHPVQAQSLAKAKQLLIRKSDPGHHNSAVHVMFAGSLDVRKPTTNQQSQTSSSVGLTVPGALCYLPSTAQVPSFSPLSNSSVADMTAVSYAQATSTLPVKFHDSKPTIV